ncbi:CBS domain-containing protein [Haloferax namakaokahaiae]|uniref:CBS domain-containing protein n=1 Tax=Haloferax namakaokahaiae TaxID=1748331 RepID=A0ABD5ZFT4_9EURY
MTVRDIARPKEELVTAEPDTEVRELARQMRDRSVGSVIVANDDEIHGIVTDRDLAIEVGGEGRNPDKLTAKEVMAEDPFTVEADSGVYELFRELREHGVRRAPVVDGDELCGIVTADDLLVLLEDEMHELSQIIRSESPPYTPA